jgi:hypothetical protein
VDGSLPPLPGDGQSAYIRPVSAQELQPADPALEPRLASGETGFEHARLHSFRHFFVSQAFLGGASESEIREWVGHADSKMVEHYRHLGQKDAQRRMEQINFVDPSASEQGCPGPED